MKKNETFVLKRFCFAFVKVFACFCLKPPLVFSKPSLVSFRPSPVFLQAFLSVRLSPCACFERLFRRGRLLLYSMHLPKAKYSRHITYSRSRLTPYGVHCQNNKHPSSHANGNNARAILCTFVPDSLDTAYILMITIILGTRPRAIILTPYYVSPWATHAIQRTFSYQQAFTEPRQRQ